MGVSCGGAVSVDFIFNQSIHKSEFSRTAVLDGGTLELSYAKKIVVQDSLFKGTDYALLREGPYSYTLQS